MASGKERELMVRKFMELFGGRFTYKDARRIHQHVGWEKGEAAGFVMKNEPSDVTKIVSTSEGTVRALKADPDVLDALENGVRSTVRQFACQPCDNVWWCRIPIRKQVSRCRRCREKYDPVPREREWGWAIFDCTNCGNRFSFYGQMNVTVCECYKCGRQVKHPTSIHRGKRRNRRRTGHRHCCLGIGCKHVDIVIHDGDPDREYDDADDNPKPHVPPT